MEYTTYWSLNDVPSHSIKSYTVFLYAIVITTIAWILIKKYKKQSDNYEKPILLWTIGFVWIISICMFSYLKFFSIDSSSIATEKIITSAPVIKGVISNFKRTVNRKKYENVTTESFYVDSIKFIYSNALLGRFNTFSQTNNVVLRDGVQVRITYSKDDKEMLKIETAYAF